MSITKQNYSSAFVLQQGEAGKLDDYAFGLVSIENANEGSRTVLVATLSTWPANASQVNRNDYLSRHRVKSGSIFPLGAKLYRVGALVNQENAVEVFEPEFCSRLRRDAIVLDATPVDLDEVSLNDHSFCISEGGTGELHGTKIRFVDSQRKNVNGKEEPRARIEMWPNDYERHIAAENGMIQIDDYSVDSEINIGGKIHKLVSINEGVSSTIPWIEIQI